jgi:hypothetical protein
VTACAGRHAPGVRNGRPQERCAVPRHTCVSTPFLLSWPAAESGPAARAVRGVLSPPRPGRPQWRGYGAESVSGDYARQFIGTLRQGDGGDLFPRLQVDGVQRLLARLGNIRDVSADEQGGPGLLPVQSPSSPRSTSNVASATPQAEPCPAPVDSAGQGRRHSGASPPARSRPARGREVRRLQRSISACAEPTFGRTSRLGPAACARPGSCKSVWKRRLITVPARARIQRWSSQPCAASPLAGSASRTANCSSLSLGSETGPPARSAREPGPTPLLHRPDADPQLTGDRLIRRCPAVVRQ